MLPVKGHIAKLKIDTGPHSNIMPFKDLKKIVGSNPQKQQPIKQSHLLKSPFRHLKSKGKSIHPRKKSQRLSRQHVEEL